MRVRLDDAAARWIARRGGAVTVRRSPRHGCCGGTAAVPVAEARAPTEPARWKVQRAEGIDVYIDPTLASAGGTVTLRAEGFGPWRRLFVEGAALSGRA